MKKVILMVAAALVALPAFADKKLDDAFAKASGLVEKGKPEEAVKGLQKTVEGSPSAEGYTLLARLQLVAASAEDAAQSAAKAVDLSGSAAPAARAEALATLAGLDLIRGSGRDALTHAQDAVKADPASVPAMAALARAQARAGDGTSALASADKAIQAGATSGIAHTARGEALLTLGRAKDAEAEFRKALEVEPKLTLARTKLASALLAQGRAAEAEEEAKKASDTDQKSAEAFAILGKAIVAKDANRWNDAIAQAQQGAFLNPRDAAVQVMVGEIFEANGNIDQAQLSYGKALAADPSYLPARLAMVQVQTRKGQLDAALNDLQKIAQETNSGPAYLQLGRIQLRKGDWPGAATTLEKAVGLLPGSAEAHARLGTALTYTGKRPEALTEYKKAVELDPANTDYRTTYGLLLGIANQDAAGVAELQKVIATPGYKLPDAYINLGWIYRNMEPKKAQESVAAYKKALELDPKQEQAALGMGWAYTYMKDWDNAIGAFQKAAEIDPTTAPEANSGVAWSYFFKKELDKAEEYLKKGAAAGRNDAKLAKNIDLVRKGQAAEGGPDLPKAPPPTPRVELPDVGTVSDQVLHGPSPAVRIRAIGQIVRFGGDALSALIGALNDPDWSVKEAAANGLGSMGPKAATAVPHLMAVLNSPRVYGGTILKKEEMAASMKEEDFRKAVRNAVLKIQGK